MSLGRLGAELCCSDAERLCCYAALHTPPFTHTYGWQERNAEIARSIRRAAAETGAPVVAILGGLHVNGVARLLMSEAVPDADKRDANGVWWVPPEGVDLGEVW